MNAVGWNPRTIAPAVREWLARVAAQAGHVRMDWHPTALAIAE